MYLRDINELRVLVGDLPMPGGPIGRYAGRSLPLPLRTGFQRARLRLGNDQERSRKLLALLFANWLPQIDRLETERAPTVIQRPTPIFAWDPSAPAAARAIDPQSLDRALSESVLADFIFRPAKVHIFGPWIPSSWSKDGPLGRERRRRSALIVRLAAELYKREHGRMPASAGELVGSDLEYLPEGLAAEDPIPDDLQTIQPSLE
jgi:hypothetical protein